MTDIQVLPFLVSELRLPADEQELLELRVVLGLSAHDVGALLDCSPGAVRMAQHRALGRLRSMMAGGVPRGAIMPCHWVTT